MPRKSSDAVIHRCSPAEFLNIRELKRGCDERNREKTGSSL